MHKSIIIFIPFIFAGCLKSETFEQKVTHLRHPDFENLDLKNATAEAGHENFHFEKDNRTLYIDRWTSTEENALKYIAEQRGFLLELYADSASPYPGALSQIVRCTDGLRPKEFHSVSAPKQRIAFQLWANARRTYGVCAADQVHFQSIYAMVFCPESKMVFEIKYFVAKNAGLDPQKFVDAFRCGEST